ncbi:hypothetical protein QR98_0085030 [Sarcoptes scabiei]|uniref:Uncharacterized protein n=1 Tax=Sarcoptes scabiei TaxID=52283 RepID=A0A132AGA9_SARSC|nr:hypothetical protein QR98_0085030 [Sarcoptes scabiei]
MNSFRFYCSNFIRIFFHFDSSFFVFFRTRLLVIENSAKLIALLYGRIIPLHQSRSSGFKIQSTI